MSVTILVTTLVWTPVLIVKIQIGQQEGFNCDLNNTIKSPQNQFSHLRRVAFPVAHGSNFFGL